MYCPKCGTYIPDGEVCCPNSGCNNKIDSITITNPAPVYTPSTQIKKNNEDFTNYKFNY